MAAMVPPRDVADVFVKQYYLILNRYPENAHKFYAETSQLGWQDCNGVMTHVTTLSSINDKILSCDYKNCVTEFNTVDAQASHDGGVMVTVTGSFLEKDKVKYLFFQNFYLATQAKGFFILNDVLRVFAPTVQSDQSDASDISVLEDTAKVSSSASLVALAEKVLPIVEPTSNAGVASVVLATSANVPTGVEPSASANVSPSVAPAANGSAPSAAAQADKESAITTEAPADKESAPSTVALADKESAPASVAQAGKVNVKPVVATASNVAPNITYASLVAKPTPVISPKAAPVAKKVAQVTPKAAPLPLANGAPKASAPALANGEPNVTTKSTTGGNSAPNARPDARGVYLGNLPSNVTKHNICEVLRKFGPFRRFSDCIQIRRHDDGFCCAFVEFESPDSARRAVEARNIYFGEIVSFVAYKKSTRGSRSPTRGGYQNGNGNQSNQSRFIERSRSSSQGAR